MSSNHFLVIDTETGGLNPEEHALLEIAACVFDDQGNMVDKFHTFLNPYGNGDKSKSLYAMKLNKFFTQDFNEDTDNLKIANSFAKWLVDSSEKYNPVLVGQNLAFDIGFIDQFMKENGIEEWNSIFGRQYFDTMMIAKLLQFKGMLKTKRLSLKAICEELEITNENAHTALSDVETTYKVLMKLLSFIKN